MNGKISKKIVCAYLYSITKYGYPPKAELTNTYLEEMHSLGFSSVELEGIREEHLMGVYNIKDQVASRIKQLDLEVPYFCVVLPGLSSLDKTEREKQLELFDKGCQIAVEFGAKGVLDNAPLPPYKFPRDIPVVRHYDEDVLNAAYLPKDISWDKVWSTMIGSYREACDIAAGYNLTYQMHPAVGVLSSTTDSFLYFHDAVKRDNLRFNIDTANQFVMKDNLALALRRLKYHIDYIHVSDNGGLKVEHLELGKGEIRWDVFFETLDVIDFDGYLGLDIGGDESGVDNLDDAYNKSAKFVAENWNKIKG